MGFVCEIWTFILSDVIKKFHELKLLKATFICIHVTKLFTPSEVENPKKIIKKLFIKRFNFQSTRNMNLIFEIIPTITIHHYEQV